VLTVPPDTINSNDPTPDTSACLSAMPDVYALVLTFNAAERKLDTMRQLTDRHPATHFGMPDFRSVTGRSGAHD
jgi:hypothetical protein